jgi:hypothetical protein
MSDSTLFGFVGVVAGALTTGLVQTWITQAANGATMP